MSQQWRDDRVEIAPGWYLEREDYEYELGMVGLFFAQFLRELNCAINGHAAAVSHTGEHRGEQYDWTTCERCQEVLSGQRPNQSEVLEDAIRAAYSAEYFASFLSEESPFLKAIG